MAVRLQELTRMSLDSYPASMPPKHWLAELSLGFALRGERSVLTRRAHRGPLYVQRPFYPEDTGACHVLLLHPPGGVAGGDELRIDVALEPRSRALLTTPAATKLYRTPHEPSAQHATLRVAQGASLEWLPQETIVFDGAHTRLSVRVDLAEGASFIGWEILCLGRPGAGERFARGRVEQRFEIWRDTHPVWLERLVLDGDSVALSAPWGADGHSVLGTFVCATERADLVDAIRASLSPRSDERLEFTAPRGVIVGRFAGARAERARACFVSAWKVLRPELLGASAEPPRIWST